MIHVLNKLKDIIPNHQLNMSCSSHSPCSTRPKRLLFTFEGCKGTYDWFNLFHLDYMSNSCPIRKHTTSIYFILTTNLLLTINISIKSQTSIFIYLQMYYPVCAYIQTNICNTIFMFLNLHQIHLMFKKPIIWTIWLKKKPTIFGLCSYNGNHTTTPFYRGQNWLKLI